MAVELSSNDCCHSCSAERSRTDHTAKSPLKATPAQASPSFNRIAWVFGRRLAGVSSAGLPDPCEANT